jgi:hypothetical protein
MKTSFKVLLPLLLLLAPPTVVQAQFTFTTNNGSITITGYTGPGGDVTIPDTTNGYPVTGIGTNVFYDCTNLTSITISTNVTSIGWEAFELCPNLTSATIPNSVTSIGNFAFGWCPSLTSATVPNGVTNIGDGAFFGCSSLTNVTIQNGVTMIGPQMFCLCSSLTNIVIPSSVTNLGAMAFEPCANLRGIYFWGNAPSVIGNEELFYGDTNATVYCLPGTLGWSATFAGRPVVVMQFDYTIDGNAITITDYLGADGAVSIPNNIIGVPVTSIGNSAFAGCTTLTNITIPSSVTNIGDNAFFGCTRLSSITIPNGVTSIGDNAFQWCDSLTSITVPGSVSSIGGFAFFGCTTLSGVYFTGNAPSVGLYLFTYGNPIIYYLPGTTGWGTTFAGLPTALWLLPNPLILSGPSFGVQTNAFGFIISWATNRSVVVEAAANLESATWLPVSTNTLTGGWSYFSDPQWTNYPGRFYRLRSP